MKRRTFLKATSVAAIALASVGNVAARILEPHLPSAAKWVEDHTDCLYVVMGDGYEFIIRRRMENLQKFFTYNAIGIYEFSTKTWLKKFRTDMYDPVTDAYWKVRDESEARTNFSGVPVMDYADLAEAGIMYDRGEENGQMIRYMFNQHAYQARVTPIWRALLAKAKAAGAKV